MTRDEKIDWMAIWVARKGLKLDLEGSCGFGRECVGISVHDTYPDYEWYDKDYTKRLDNNEDVWTPPDAYHKHPCVAVLGRGEEAEAQLFDWLKWFDENNFKLETGEKEVDPDISDEIVFIMNEDIYVRMVKQHG